MPFLWFLRWINLWVCIYQRHFGQGAWFKKWAKEKNKAEQRKRFFQEYSKLNVKTPCLSLSLIFCKNKKWGLFWETKQLCSCGHKALHDILSKASDFKVRQSQAGVGREEWRKWCSAHGREQWLWLMCHSWGCDRAREGRCSRWLRLSCSICCQAVCSPRPSSARCRNGKGDILMWGKKQSCRL